MWFPPPQASLVRLAARKVAMRYFFVSSYHALTYLPRGYEAHIDHLRQHCGVRRREPLGLERLFAGAITSQHVDDQ